MAKVDTASLLRRLDALEREADPQHAEERAFEVLAPLLDADGYDVSHTGGRNDGGIDFLGVLRDNGSSGLPSRLGVQYKHRRRPIDASTVREVIGAAVVNDMERMLLLSPGGFSDGARRVLERSLPTVVELVDLTFLHDWIVRLEAPPSAEHKTVVQAVMELSSLLARIVARDPDELDSIEWRDMERMVHAVFSKLGFKTTLTPPAKDGGRDVILEFVVNGTARSYLVEVKHWRSRQKVGKGFVSDFVRVVASERRDGGLFLATYGYNGKAFETLTEIERQTFYAGDQMKIVALCRTFVRAESGLLQAPSDLTELITSDTHRPGGGR